MTLHPWSRKKEAFIMVECPLEMMDGQRQIFKWTLYSSSRTKEAFIMVKCPLKTLDVQNIRHNLIQKAHQQYDWLTMKTFTLKYVYLFYLVAICSFAHVVLKDIHLKTSQLLVLKMAGKTRLIVRTEPFYCNMFLMQKI